MTVDEGCEYFENISNIKTKLLTLKKVGLGYIKIGQQATTLSGGEAQRIKLAKELPKDQLAGLCIYWMNQQLDYINTTSRNYLRYFILLSH